MKKFKTFLTEDFADKLVGNLKTKIGDMRRTGASVGVVDNVGTISSSNAPGKDRIVINFKEPNVAGTDPKKLMRDMISKTVKQYKALKIKTTTKKNIVTLTFESVKKELTEKIKDLKILIPQAIIKNKKPIPKKDFSKKFGSFSSFEIEDALDDLVELNTIVLTSKGYKFNA